MTEHESTVSDRHASARIPVVQPACTNERGHSKRLGKMSDEERAQLAAALSLAQKALGSQDLPGEEP